MSSLTVGSSAKAATPYFAVWFPPQRKWIRALALTDVVAEFCASRDWGAYGASDVGGRLPLYLMSPSGTEKRSVGFVKYNGDVVLKEVL